ncbi:646f602f-1565-4a96-9a88-25b0add71e18 [Sclerotinia trifoliorum]|uniref:646f602f-1565-4a96-9a88-25b0add71e18 n=1 Tax=Sclerotinia trifoliorum TaxID=28548 RepID=A0A8H2ZN67_9HELO|nr:646f602f-1565-4a96-9a88-25b0add71e18 [Sclerotinia trifoliorum]
MVSLDSRDLVPFPPGSNASDTLIEGVHYNLTTLKHWNYTYYSNGTFSNGSLCFILFKPYTPHLLQNGTFLNSTSCYSPIKSMAARSIIGLVVGILFLISIMFTLINLRKHGRTIISPRKRFRAVSRRWQWYWMLIIGTCGGISGISAVDVDRYFLPELPFALTNFFWFLMLPATMAAVWESVRHWGSWQERQMLDIPENRRALREDDRRTKMELVMPLVFYFFFWLNFLLVIPRSWGSFEKQRDLDQSNLIAAPAATDIRFKLAAFFLLGGWLTTIYSLQHSIYHYRSHEQGFLNRFIALFKHTPAKFFLTLFLSLVMIGYIAAISFYFPISPLNIRAKVEYIYPLGWGPIALILLVYEVAGYLNPNEDRDLLRQRRTRDLAADEEMGYTRKPRWWSRLHGDNKFGSVQERITANVAQVGGGVPTTKGLERVMEMQDLPSPTRDERDTQHPTRGIGSLGMAAGVSYPPRLDTEERFRDNPPRTRDSEASSVTQVESEQGASTNSTVSVSAPPQQIRSMLDV